VLRVRQTPRALRKSAAAAACTVKLSIKILVLLILILVVVALVHAAQVARKAQVLRVAGRHARVMPPVMLARSLTVPVLNTAPVVRQRRRRARELHHGSCSG
jgi:hypothetical protein